MKNNRLMGYSTILLAAMLFIGCETANRLDEKSRGSVDQNSTLPIGDQPNTPSDDQNDDQNITPISQTPILDNNDSTSVIKVDATNAYKLSMTLSSSKYQQYENGILTYTLKELYSNNQIDSSLIASITFSVEDTRYFKFVDYTGKETDYFSITASDETVIKAENSIRVKMNDNSGTTAIKVTVNLKLPDGNTYEMINTIPVVVIKNQTASIAVNPYGTRWINDGENAGLFVEKYVFHVVDKYGNKAKDGTSVKIGVVNEPKLYSLGYTTINDAAPINTTGELKKDKTFTITSEPNVSFTGSSIDNEDNLVILPNRIKNDPTYLGAWSIDYVNNADTMTLIDDYTGNDSNKTPIGNTTDLTFVVGDEDRYNPCSKTLANAAFYFPEGAEVKDGLVYAELRYQPYLFGKTAFVYANAVVDGERIGIAREVHLLGEGLKPVTVSCKNETLAPINCTIQAPMVMEGNEGLARWTYPGITDSTHPASSTNTECGGSTLVTIYGVAPDKTGSATVGGIIHWEKIINK